MNREDFPMLKNNIIYFDNSATTLKPNSVINGITDYYNNYSANAHRGDYDISYKVDVAYENARVNVAKFINAEVNEVVFTSGTTESLNMIVNGYFKYNLTKDDEVLITYAEHASNVLPWFNLSKEIGINVKYIPIINNKITIDSVKESITEKTKVISIAHITNVLGDERPIKEICKLAHEKGIKVVVDGAQSAPHIKVDVKNLDCDFYAFSGHKMMGPTGVGVLYGKYELLNLLKPTNLGGGMNESFDDEDNVFLKELPTRLEAGTPNIAGVIGLSKSIDYINSIGIDNINKHELYLKDYLINNLRKIDHIKILNENTDSGIISITIDDIFPQDIAYYLNKYNICVRAGNHCAKILKHYTNIKNTLRISLYMYNTIEECDKLISLLKDKDKIMKEMI